MDLLALIRSLPMHEHVYAEKSIGYAVGYGDIFSELKSRGYDNKDLLDVELEKLESAGKVKLFRMDGFDENLIFAVRPL